MTRYQICMILSSDMIQFPVYSLQLPDTDANVVLVEVFPWLRILH